MTFGAQNDEHLVPFHPRPGLYFTNIPEVFFQPLKDAGAKFTVRHFTTAKPDRSLHLVATDQPLTGMLHTVIVVVIVGSRTELHFLYRNNDLFLLGLVRLLLGFVLELAKVDYSANRRLGARSNLDKVKPLFTRRANRFASVHHPELFAIITDHAHRGHANPFVYTRGWSAAVIRTLTTTSKAGSYFCTSKIRVHNRFRVRVLEPGTAG